MDRRTCAVAQFDGSLTYRFEEPRPDTNLINNDSAALHGLHTTCPDQQIGLQTADWRAQQMKVANALPDQSTRRGHGGPAFVLGDRKHLSGLDHRDEIVERNQRLCLVHSKRSSTTCSRLRAGKAIQPY